MTRPARSVVVLAGEDANDRNCLRIIIEKLCPRLRGRLVDIRDPVRLRDAKTKLAERVDTLHKHARAAARSKNSDLACLIVCEDFDAPESQAARATRRRVRQALISRVGNGHYLLATAELEAWLLLFPQALDSFAAGWHVPRRRSAIDTGLLSAPKEVVRSEVSSKKRRYLERDAPAIVQRIVETCDLTAPAGRNTSWNLLHTEVAACCREHA